MSKKEYFIMKDDPTNTLYSKRRLNRVDYAFFEVGSPWPIFHGKEKFKPAPIHLVVAARLRGELGEDEQIPGDVFVSEMERNKAVMKFQQEADLQRMQIQQTLQQQQQLILDQLRYGINNPLRKDVTDGEQRS